MSEIIKNKGKVLKEEGSIGDDELELINKYTRRQYKSDELYVFNVVLCDNEIDRDNEVFSINALNQLSNLFIGKTGIANHNPVAENQTARIFACRVENVQGKKTTYGADYYRLLAKAYMPKNEYTQKDIQLIEAGIKKEVSVGCSIDRVLCSVCKTDVRQHSCEHFKGENGCYYILDNITDAYEWSFVAVPSQKEAGVVKSYITQSYTTQNADSPLKTDALIDEIKRCNFKAVNSSNIEYLAEYIKQLEVNAEYGKAFRESLEKDYIRYCGLCFENTDSDMLLQVAKKLTLKELQEFVAVYKGKVNAENYCLPQLVSNKQCSDENINNSFTASFNDQYNI